MSFPPFTATHCIWVRKDGNDTTGDGGILLPFLTVAKALSVITGASIVNRYLIFLGPGRFDEAVNLNLKPWVWINGNGDCVNGPTRLTSPNNAIGLDASFAAGSGHNAGLLNLSLAGATGLNFDLTAIGGNISRVLELNNVVINGSVTFKAFSGVDYLDWNSGRCFDAVNIQGGNFFVGNCLLLGALNLSTPGPQNVDGDFSSCAFGGNFSASSSGGRTVAARLHFSSIDGTLTVDQAATTVRVDATSCPPAARLTVTNGGVLTRANDAGALSFTPAAAGDWPVQPSLVKDALDKLAARIAALEP